jgi:hypothetical protein
MWKNCNFVRLLQFVCLASLIEEPPRKSSVTKDGAWMLFSCRLKNPAQLQFLQPLPGMEDSDGYSGGATSSS